MGKTAYGPRRTKGSRPLDRRQFLSWLSRMAVGGGLLLAPGARLLRADDNEEGAPYDVVIVGGGISGLTAAYLLQTKRILVLEQENALGGRICSGRWEGFDYPKGMEYIGEPEEHVAGWFEELELEPIPIPPPTGAIAHQGKIHAGRKVLDFLPSEKALKDYMRLGEALYELSKGGVEAGVFEDLEKLEPFAELDELSVAEWMKEQSFHPLVQQLIDIENRGLFGAANEDLSFLFNIPEMSYNLYDPEEADESGVYSFRRGMIEVVEALEKRLAPVVRKGAHVTRLTWNKDDSISVTFVAKGESKTVRARCVVLSTPAAVTASIAGSCFSEDVREALRAIPYVPYVTLNLFLSERVWKEAWSMACLDDFFVTLYDALRTQVPAEYDEKGILGAYIPPKNASDTSLMQLSDEEIVRKTLTDLKKYDPAIEEKVEGYDLKRFQYAFPVFRPGYGEILETLTEARSTHGPLFLAGDYMVYATFDGAVISAVRASKRVKEYL